MAPAGAAVRASAPETRILGEAEVSAWLKSASAGDRLVYCVGPAMLPGPTLDLLLELTRDEKVVTHKRRGDAGALEHYLIKLAGRPVARAVAETVDEHAERIFSAIERCAERRRRCPSNRDLARIAGLATREQAAWRLARLIKEGRLTVSTVSTSEGPWRVAEIMGRRLRTAPAPGSKT